MKSTPTFSKAIASIHVYLASVYDVCERGYKIPQFVTHRRLGGSTPWDDRDGPLTDGQTLTQTDGQMAIGTASRDHDPEEGQEPAPGVSDGWRWLVQPEWRIIDAGDKALVAVEPAVVHVSPGKVELVERRGPPC